LRETEFSSNHENQASQQDGAETATCIRAMTSQSPAEIMVDSLEGRDQAFNVKSTMDTSWSKEDLE
jgi:hypothetical protein